MALCLLASCTLQDAELGRLYGDGGTGVVVSSCGLSSPLVHLPGRATCSGRLAAAHFGNALCSCSNIQLASSLVTRGFDSRQGPYQDSERSTGGASVGVNGSYLSFGGADIGGAFSIAGPADVAFRGTLGVRGDLWVAGNVSSVGLGVVARNAWLGGTLMARGPFTVAGTLNHAGAATAVPLIAGADRAGPVTVAKPCPCEASELVDIGALVEAGRTDNDNATLKVSPAAFSGFSVPQERSLPCGRVFLTSIDGTGNVLIHVTGKTAIFVDGSIELNGALLFDVAPGAEVDLFVRNNVAALAVAMASKERPSAGRLWVGGAQPIVLGSPWVGNLYAPHALVSAHLAVEVWGSVFAGDFSGEFATTVVFDRAIIDSGATCAAPPPPSGTCSRCGVCSGGNACVSGVCGACTADSDCCGLSICANGSCAPWLDVQSQSP